VGMVEEQGDLGHPRNRVLVGLPDRLNAAKGALKDHERTLEQIRQVYAQRGLVSDHTICDRIGELLQ